MKFHQQVVFGDGDVLSIQASSVHYCVPRKTDATSYKSVEVGNVANIELPSRWNRWKQTSESEFDVFPYVPVVLVHELIKSKGGIVAGDCPPLELDNYNNRPVN